MDGVRVKSYAKINLTLCVTGAEGGYHSLDSIVATVDLYDLIKVKKRKDKLVTVTMRGMGSESIEYSDNNAAKAAELFIERYSSGGADITVYKNIPMGAGLGGSSADAAGVLRALAKLYKTDDTAGLKLLADRTGSDTRYMLSGGFARLYGRGDIVKELESGLKLYLLLLVPPQRVSTPQCFKAFDALCRAGGNSDEAEWAIVSNDLKKLAKTVKNALMPAARTLSADIKDCADSLYGFDPLAVSMTGSGSGVYALFENKEMCEYAKSRYRGPARAYVLTTR